MPFRTVDLLAPRVRTGDATSDHTFELARLLAAQGAQVRIWCSHPPGSRLPQDIDSLVRVVHYADYTPAADLTILQYPIWFPLAERFRQAKGTAVFWYHGVTPPELWETEEGQDRLINAQLRTHLAWYAHVAVAASPFTAAELHRHAGYPRERIRVVPLSVNTGKFSQAPAAPELARLRRQWKLEGKQILLYVGRLAGNKRIDLLIEALARLAPKYPNLHLLVVGNRTGDSAAEQLHARLQQQAIELGVGERVTFTGRVAQVASYYHLADLFLLASQHEGFGVPLVEAMAAGVPVVASASGAIPWVLGVDDGEEAGLVFPPGDVQALAGAIEQVLTQPALAATLINRGRKLAERYHRRHFEERVRAVLDEACDLARRGPAPWADQRPLPLHHYTDVALRSYRIKSTLPVVGPLIEWIRHNMTVHIKEAYLDRIIEQQVNLNRLLVEEIAALQDEVARLQADVAELAQKRSDKTAVNKEDGSA